MLLITFAAFIFYTSATAAAIASTLVKSMKSTVYLPVNTRLLTKSDDPANICVKFLRPMNTGFFEILLLTS